MEPTNPGRSTSVISPRSADGLPAGGRGHEELLEIVYHDAGAGRSKAGGVTSPVHSDHPSEPTVTAGLDP